MEMKKSSPTGSPGLYRQLVPPPTMMRSCRLPSLLQMLSCTRARAFSGSLFRMQAPAPSPKSTQVLRSLQLTRRVRASVQTKRIWEAGSWQSRASARCRPYRKPEQAEPKSKDMAGPAPMLPPMMQESEGLRWSGVQVAVRMWVSLAASRPASSRALRAAWVPRSEAFSS